MRFCWSWCPCWGWFKEKTHVLLIPPPDFVLNPFASPPGNLGDFERTVTRFVCHLRHGFASKLRSREMNCFPWMCLWFPLRVHVVSVWRLSVLSVSQGLPFKEPTGQRTLNDSRRLPVRQFRSTSVIICVRSSFTRTGIQKQQQMASAQKMVPKMGPW